MVLVVLARISSGRNGGCLVAAQVLGAGNHSNLFIFSSRVGGARANVEPSTNRVGFPRRGQFKYMACLLMCLLIDVPVLADGTTC